MNIMNIFILLDHLDLGNINTTIIMNIVILLITLILAASTLYNFFSLTTNSRSVCFLNLLILIICKGSITITKHKLIMINKLMMMTHPAGEDDVVSAAPRQEIVHL